MRDFQLKTLYNIKTKAHCFISHFSQFRTWCGFVLARGATSTKECSKRNRQTSGQLFFWLPSSNYIHSIVKCKMSKWSTQIKTEYAADWLHIVNSSPSTFELSLRDVMMWFHDVVKSLGENALNLNWLFVKDKCTVERLIWIKTRVYFQR